MPLPVEGTRRQDTTNEVDISHLEEAVVHLVNITVVVGILGGLRLETVLGLQQREGLNLLAIPAMLAPEVGGTVQAVETVMVTVMGPAAEVRTLTVEAVMVEVVAVQIIQVALHQHLGDMARQHPLHQLEAMEVLPRVVDLLMAVEARRELTLLQPIHQHPSTREGLDHMVAQLVLGHDHMVAAVVAAARVAAVTGVDCSDPILARSWGASNPRLEVRMCTCAHCLCVHASMGLRV